MQTPDVVIELEIDKGWEEELRVPGDADPTSIAAEFAHRLGLSPLAVAKISKAIERARAAALQNLEAADATGFGIYGVDGDGQELPLSAR